MRVALKVAYDGTAFQGSQRQPDARTVEGDLLVALARIGAAADAASCGFEAAGRTDAGVSAAGNVVALDTAFRPEQIARALNGHLDDAWVLARAEVPPGWSPRRAADRRTYAYFGPPSGDLRAAQDAFARFVGEHDFASFARPQPGRTTWSRVTAARVEADGDLWRYTVTGTAFLWNQVRRMVAAAEAAGRGEATGDDVARALAGERLDLGVAPPEGLVLLEVAYRDVSWVAEARDTEDLLAAFASRRLRARAAERREVLFHAAARAVR